MEAYLRGFRVSATNTSILFLSSVFRFPPIYIVSSNNAYHSQCSNDLTENTKPRILSSILVLNALSSLLYPSSSKKSARLISTISLVSPFTFQTQSPRPSFDDSRNWESWNRLLCVQQPRGKDGCPLDGGWTMDTLLYPGIAGWGGSRIRWNVYRCAGGRAIGNTNTIGYPLTSRRCTGRDAHSRADDRALTLRLAHPQLILPLLFLLQVNLRVERLTGFRLLQHTHKPTVSLEPWLGG